MLLICLPMIVGNQEPIDEPKWRKLILLIQTVLTALSPVASLKLAVMLKTLIAILQFLANYPNASFIAKLHYMVHFQKQILVFGLFWHYWHLCMWWESKNGHFKNYKNFKNRCKSSALDMVVVLFFLLGVLPSKTGVMKQLTQTTRRTLSVLWCKRVYSTLLDWMMWRKTIVRESFAIGG